MLIGLLSLTVAVRGQGVSVEYRLKAAFVARFPEFVEWPPPAWLGRTTLDMCVLTPDPFGKDLPDIVGGQSVRGRSVVIHEVQPDAPLDLCHVLYVTRGADRRAAILQRAAVLPILTISDEPTFLDAGGIIQLNVVDNRIRFDISYSAADRVGWRLSSQLLRLANDPRHLLSMRMAVDLPRAIEVAVIGQDLLHSSHPEFGSATPARVEFERSVRVAVTRRRP